MFQKNDTAPMSFVNIKIAHGITLTSPSQFDVLCS